MGNKMIDNEIAFRKWCAEQVGHKNIRWNDSKRRWEGIHPIHLDYRKVEMKLTLDHLESVRKVVEKKYEFLVKGSYNNDLVHIEYHSWDGDKFNRIANATCKDHLRCWTEALKQVWQWTLKQEGL